MELLRTNQNKSEQIGTNYDFYFHRDNEAMGSLIKWYNNQDFTHPLVKSSIFAYDFLSIHPFQDGNGRLSRLLSTLLLLKQGYRWIEYVSFEHEIENRKTEYYSQLRQCQLQRPGKDVTSWILFFFDALKNIQKQLMEKLEYQGEQKISSKEKLVLTFISSYPGTKTGEISKKLAIPTHTVKRILSQLLVNNLVEKHGKGAGINYTLL